MDIYKYSSIREETTNPDINILKFSNEELLTATDYYFSGSDLGRGALSFVFKGELERTGQMVAVKKVPYRGLINDKEIMEAILMFSQMCHPNLVNLVGFSLQPYWDIVIEEFMPLGSLKHHLHDLNTPPLDWNQRMTIAFGVAKGLSYLHNETKSPVIHRDLRSSKILLDENFNPKISEFWIAKLVPSDKWSIKNRAVRSRACCAPEYLDMGKLTTGSDVYNFGLLLLELLTGRPVMEMENEDRPNKRPVQFEWASDMLKYQNDYVKIADQRLRGRFSRDIFCQVVEVALMCLKKNHEDRPDIAEVASILGDLASRGVPTSFFSALKQCFKSTKIRSPIYFDENPLEVVRLWGRTKYTTFLVTQLSKYESRT